jgi:flagellar biosynthesis component FlhA
VKGDVIASLIITIINILGGLAIGVGQRDMELAVALKRYGLLTIGDGLVTQIPALVMATAAGVLVTRELPAKRRKLRLAPSWPRKSSVSRRLCAWAASSCSVWPPFPACPACPFW